MHTSFGEYDFTSRWLEVGEKVLYTIGRFLI